MAKIPDIQSLGPRPSPQRTSLAPGVAQDGVMGEVFQGIGRNLSGFSQQLRVIQERENQYFVQEAGNKLKKELMDLSSDYSAKKSSGVAENKDFFAEYMRRFDEKSLSVRGGLKNDDQIEMFRKRSEVAKLSFGGRLAGHITEQTNVYQKQIYLGGLAVDLESASKNYISKNAVLSEIVSTKELTKAEMERLGITGDAKKITLFENESAIHVAVINQAVSEGNTSYARLWYDKNKKNISANQTSRIERILKKSTARKESQDIVDEYTAGGWSLKKARTDVRKKYSGELEDQIISRLEKRDKELIFENKRQETLATDYVWSYLFDEENIDKDLPDETWMDKLPPHERLRIEKWANNFGSQEGRTSSDRDAMMMLNDMARKNPQGVTNEFILKISPFLTDGDYRSALKLIGKPENVETWNSKEEIKNNILLKAKLDPKDEFTGSGDSERIEAIKTKMNKEFIKLQRKPTAQEIQQIGDRVLLDQVYVNTWDLFSFDRKRPVATFTASEIKNLEDVYVKIDGANLYTYKDIPPAERDRIIRDLESAKIPVTEERIAELWLDLKGKPKKGPGIIGDAEFQKAITSLGKDRENDIQGLDSVDDLRLLMNQNLENAKNLIR